MTAEVARRSSREVGRSKNKKKRNTNEALDLSWNKKKRVTNNGDFDLDVSSDDESDDFEDKDSNFFQSDVEDDIEEETVDEKRIRITREYLNKIAHEDDKGVSDEESGDDDDRYNKVSLKLQRERLKQQGLYYEYSDISNNIENYIKEVKESLENVETAGGSKATTTVGSESRSWISNGYITQLPRGHDLTPTCISLLGDSQRSSTTNTTTESSFNNKYCVSGSKDHSVILWDIEYCKKMNYICETYQRKMHSNGGEVENRNDGQVLSITASGNGNYVAVGKRDATICIYDVRISPSLSKGVINANNNHYGKSSVVELVHTFDKGHKGPISSLCFDAPGSLTLFSSSLDRCIRQHDCTDRSNMMYVETLYGHQNGVSCVDTFGTENSIISTGLDRTIRLWKIQEDTHLIYRGGGRLYNSDVVKTLNKDHFVTGHTNTSTLCLWNINKKKPISVMNNTHHTPDGSSNSNNNCSSITSIGTIKGSDFIITGSNDGYLRLWNVNTERKENKKDNNDYDRIRSIGSIPLKGYVNDIAIDPNVTTLQGKSNSSSARPYCVTAVGQEHKFGRWDRISKAKNRINIIHLLPPASLQQN